MMIGARGDATGRRLALGALAGCAACVTPVSRAVEPAPPSVFDQPRIELARALPGGADIEDVGAGIEAHGDGAVVVGWTSKPGGAEDALLLCVDSQGDVVWRKSLGGDGEDLLWDVHADGGGGFVAAGYAARAAGRPEHDGWLVRFTPAGDISWERRFDGPADVRIYSIARDGDDWLCAGQMDDGAGDVDAMVIRVTRGGEERGRSIWKTPSNDRAFAAQAVEGGCVLAGMTGRGHDDAHAFVVKVDGAGHEVWRVVLEDSTFSVVHGLRAMGDGRFLATGYRQTGAPLGVQGFALVIDGTGAIVRTTSIGGAGDDRMLHAAMLPNGACVVVGYAQAPDAPDGRSGWDLALAALDPLGRACWSARLGGDATEFGRGVALAGPRLWVVGHTSASRNGGSAVYVMRLNLAPLLRTRRPDPGRG